MGREGAWFIGHGLAQYLAADGEVVHEVSGPLTAARRGRAVRRGKSDRLDAHAVALLLREEAARLLRVVAQDDATAAVQIWSRTQAELTKA